jgi:hypothetical protein
MRFERRREPQEHSVDEVLSGVESPQVNRHQELIRARERMLDQARFAHAPFTQKHETLLMGRRFEYA